MNTDWTQLGMDASEPIGVAINEYEPNSGRPRQAEPGRYTLIGDPDSVKFGVARTGTAYFTADFTIVGGEFDGKPVRGFISASVPKWRKGSDLNDFLAATAAPAPESGGAYTTQEVLDHLPVCLTKPFTAKVGLEYYCRNCKKTVLVSANRKDIPQAPTNEEGQFLQTAQCPVCGGWSNASAKIERIFVG